MRLSSPPPRVPMVPGLPVRLRRPLACYLPIREVPRSAHPILSRTAPHLFLFISSPVCYSTFTLRLSLLASGHSASFYQRPCPHYMYSRLYISKRRRVQCSPSLATPVITRILSTPFTNLTCPTPEPRLACPRHPLARLCRSRPRRLSLSKRLPRCESNSLQAISPARPTCLFRPFTYRFP